MLGCTEGWWKAVYNSIRGRQERSRTRDKERLLAGKQTAERLRKRDTVRNSGYQEWINGGDDMKTQVYRLSLVKERDVDYKVKGIRAALVTSVENAHLTKEHNNANILCLGAKDTSQDLALNIVDEFINTPFAGGRHERRVNKLMETEE